jgi:L-threonylcarbamoyladenylate synthase
VTERWPADAEHIARAAERLRQGALIAFPTDTLYAVGCRVADQGAIRRLYQVKRRPSTQPNVLLVKDRAQVDTVAVVNQRAASLMQRYWPGPLTLVLPAKFSHPIVGRAGPPAHASRAERATRAFEAFREKAPDTIAVRAPNHPVALALLKQLDEPIASSSANRATAPAPVDADQVIAGLGDDLDIVLDGGPCQIGEQSTILDLSGAPPCILRQGAIPAKELLKA